MILETIRQEAKAFGVDLSEDQAVQFDRYFHLLSEWNEKINLTAITEEQEVLIKHFLDSLSGAQFMRLEDRVSVADIGTGAGFPGMALAIAFPKVHFTLMDATGKKVRFLQMVSDTLGLKNVTAVQGRAEELAHDPAYREQFDIVTSRAVASLPVLLEYCAGFVKKGGVIAAYKGPSLEEELALARTAVPKLHLELKQKEEIRIGDHSHTIAVFEKKKALEERYPRPHAQIRKKSL